MMFVLTARPENFFRLVATYRDLLFPVSYTTYGIHQNEKRKKKKAQLIDCVIDRIKHTFGRNYDPAVNVYMSLDRKAT